MSQNKPTPILPPGQAEERPLFVIMVIMSFLAALTLIASLMGMRQSASWQNDLKSTATLQVISDTPQNIEAHVNRAVEILKATPGIKSAQRVSDADNRKLLNPWIGELGLPEDIILPALIRLSVDDTKLDIAALTSKLTADGISASYDNHSQWSKNLSTTWQRLRLALMGILILMIASTVAISSFATQSVLRARQNIINVLGQVGATDEFIAQLFVKRFLSLGFKAAITGTVLAVMFVALFMVWQNLGTDSSGLKLDVQLTDLFWLILLAIVMGLISALSAGRSTMQTIQSQRQYA